MNKENQSRFGKDNVCKDLARIIMKRGNALNVVEITHIFFFLSYLELPEPLILVMVSKQTLDQKEAGQDL